MVSSTTVVDNHTRHNQLLEADFTLVGSKAVALARRLEQTPPPSEASRENNERLKRLVTDLSDDKHMLSEAAHLVGQSVLFHKWASQ